jgi:hypothetical protein
MEESGLHDYLVLLSVFQTCWYLIWIKPTLATDSMGELAADRAVDFTWQRGPCGSPRGGSQPVAELAPDHTAEVW